MLYARDHNMPAFKAIRAVVPIYMTSDCLTSFPSGREIGERGAILRQSDMTFYRRTFLGSTIAESLEIGVAVDSMPLSQETVTALTNALTTRPGTPKSGRRSTDADALVAPLNVWRQNRLAIAEQLTHKISERVWQLSNCVYWSPAIHPMFDCDTKFSADDVALSLPAVLLVQAELDVLRDESILMAACIQNFVERTRRLSMQPSAPVRVHMMPQAPHGLYPAL
jgi:acetyl esterase/lipase